MRFLFPLLLLIASTAWSAVNDLPSGPVTVATAASNTPIGSVSLGNSLGKTLVMKTGSLTTSATTADQVILTYTVTAGKTFYLQHLDISARLTVLSATAAILGLASVETPSGTKVYSYTFTNATTQTVDRTPAHDYGEGLPIAAGAVIRVVVTPAAATSMLWVANLGGYEK